MQVAAAHNIPVQTGDASEDASNATATTTVATGAMSGTVSDVNVHNPKQE
jgi:hypothetical protein